MDPDNKIGCRNRVVDVIVPAYFELLVRPGPRQGESRKILQISQLRCKIAALIMYCMTNIRLRISLILSNQNWILNLCSWKLHNCLPSRSLSAWLHLQIMWRFFAIASRMSRDCSTCYMLIKKDCAAMNWNAVLQTIRLRPSCGQRRICQRGCWKIIRRQA